MIKLFTKKLKLMKSWYKILENQVNLLETANGQKKILHACINYSISYSSFGKSEELLLKVCTVCELDVDQFPADPTIFPCGCDKSPFFEKDHGHFLTRDLNILKINKLRKIFVLTQFIINIKPSILVRLKRVFFMV